MLQFCFSVPKLDIALLFALAFTALPIFYVYRLARRILRDIGEAREMERLMLCQINMPWLAPAPMDRVKRVDPGGTVIKAGLIRREEDDG